MLGESDLIYTQTLCCIGKENYKGKSVLILGGGDGGILHELLKEGPDLVVMAEVNFFFFHVSSFHIPIFSKCKMLRWVISSIYVNSLGIAFVAYTSILQRNFHSLILCKFCFSYVYLTAEVWNISLVCITCLCPTKLQ